MDAVQVKQEVIERLQTPNSSQKPQFSNSTPVIDLSSSSDDSDSDDSSALSSDDDGAIGSASGTGGKRPRVSSGGVLLSKKKKKLEKLAVALPLGFLDPLPPKNASLPPPRTQSVAPKEKLVPVVNGNGKSVGIVESSRQFWKAGDYADGNGGDWDNSSGMHVSLKCSVFVSALSLNSSIGSSFVLNFCYATFNPRGSSCLECFSNTLLRSHELPLAHANAHYVSWGVRAGLSHIMRMRSTN